MAHVVPRAVVVDTSVLVDYLRSPDSDSAQVLNELRRRGTRLYTTSISVYELALGAHLHRDAATRYQELLELKRSLQVLEVDQEASLRAGAADARLVRTGQSVGVRDLLIGSTSLRHKLPILTLNRQHFDRIEGLRVLTPKDMMTRAASRRT